MKASRKSPARLLEEAADLLEEHGWITGHCWRKQGMCALGAIAAATYPAALTTDPHQLNALGYQGKQGPKNLRAAITALSDVIEGELPRYGGAVDEEYKVYRFNDDFAGTRERVTAKLREAAQSLRVKNRKAA